MLALTGDGCSAAVQREGWAMDPSSGLCQVSSNLPDASHPTILSLAWQKRMLQAASALGDGGLNARADAVIPGRCQYMYVMSRTHLTSACAIQINQPEAPDIQQAEPEQLEELTQYLLHLESS